jgi:hypothetical protein
MSNYLLALLLVATCLAGIPLDTRLKQVLHIALAIVAVAIAFGDLLNVTVR